MRLQNELFDLGSELATPPGGEYPGMFRIGDEQVTALEHLIDRCQEELEPLKSFVLPGGGRVGDLTIKFLHTPGHTPGSQCFLVDGNLVSGDTLFIGACGRADLPGSNAEDLWRSLNETLKVLPEQTVLFPGHNYSDRPTSTIGAESRTNPYLRIRLDQFLSMMGH